MPLNPNNKQKAEKNGKSQFFSELYKRGGQRTSNLCVPDRRGRKIKGVAAYLSCDSLLDTTVGTRDRVIKPELERVSCYTQQGHL